MNEIVRRRRNAAVVAFEDVRRFGDGHHSDDRHDVLAADLLPGRVEDGPSAAISLPPARYGLPVVEKSSVIITLAAGEDGKAVVYKANGAVADAMIDGSDIEAQEDEIAAYVEQELAQSGRRPQGERVDQGGARDQTPRGGEDHQSGDASRRRGQLYVAVLEVQQ
jgi:hypothetical protein